MGMGAWFSSLDKNASLASAIHTIPAVAITALGCLISYAFAQQFDIKDLAGHVIQSCGGAFASPACTHYYIHNYLYGAVFAVLIGGAGGFIWRGGQRAVVGPKTQ